MTQTIMQRLKSHPIPIMMIALIWVIMLIACLPLLQRISNGSDHYFMIDVGEGQIVLNNWGTLHATGYPHFVMLGNLFTDILTLFGVRPLVAAALFSLVWGLIAAALIYLLLVQVMERPILSAAVTVAYVLTRTVWIHHLIVEIYSFGLAILAGLLLIGLYQGVIHGWNHSPYARTYWLALLGGMGVAHHRAIVMVAPALLFAVCDELTQDWRKVPLVLLKALILGILGFLPYAYLMIRARMGADWVYGEPQDWHGLWLQFTGEEASRFIGLPGSFTEFVNNFNLVNSVLLVDVTLIGVILGVVGLIVGVVTAKYRQFAITMLLSGTVAYGFHVVYYTDVLSALIMPITLSLAFGWLLLLDFVLGWQRIPSTATVFASSAIVIVFYSVMVQRNVPFIRELVTNSTGLETIETVSHTPPGSTLMLPWGPRHFAVGYALDIEHSLPDITLVDHKADYTSAFEAGMLVVPEYVRFRYPLDWWQEQLNAPIYPVAVGAGLVSLQPQPDQLPDVPESIAKVSETVSCDDGSVYLEVDWQLPAESQSDLSVFVHLLNASGEVIAQDDQFAPVYGWRPVSTWMPGEVVHDVYTLPNLEDGHTIRYGYYHQLQDGSFENVVEYEVLVACEQ